MKRLFLITGVFFLAGIFFSCRKISVVNHSGEAEWIKVITDSFVRFPGKIRADAQNNLYCSYNYENPELAGSWAIVKLDTTGKVAWRRNFADTAIYDFITTPGGLVLASYSNGIISVSTLSYDALNIVSNSYALPSEFTVTKIKNFFGMKLLVTSENNYNICGTFQYKQQGSKQQSIGFMLEVTPAGIKRWMQIYYFLPDSEPATHITGCAQNADSFILFGNVRYKEPDTSAVVIMHTDIMGNLDASRTRFYATSTYDSIYHGYYCETSDIIPSNKGSFFACAHNIVFNTFSQNSEPITTSDDNSARIFEISREGEIINTVNIKYGEQNEVADFVLMKNGGLLLGLNPNRLGDVSIVFERNSFIATLSPTPELALQGINPLQSQFSDYLGSVCAMPDGHYAIETMIQSLGSDHYYLEVIKTDENGNF